MNDPKTCPHTAFAVKANVNRVTLPSGTLGAALLTVSCSCEDCGSSFWFPGLGTGTSYTEPVTSTDGFQLIAPLAQANRRNTPDPSLVSVATRNGDRVKGFRP